MEPRNHLSVCRRVLSCGRALQSPKVAVWRPLPRRINVRTLTRLRSRRGTLALTFALSVLLVVFMTTMACLLTLSLAGSHTERAVVGTQALYAAEAGLSVALQTGQAGPLVGGLPRGRYAVQRLGDRLVAMGQAERALGTPLRRVVTVGAGGSDWREAPPAQYPQLAALLDREAAER